MEMETVLRFLVSLPILLIAGSVVSYFKSPEDFFIRRLRPKEGAEYTHIRLVSRAFSRSGDSGATHDARGSNHGIQRLSAGVAG